MNILFICTGNTCRSPMAEGIFKELVKESKIPFTVSSCGIFAADGDLPTNEAVRACQELNINISNHKSKNIMDTDINSVDLFVVMTQNHAQLLLSFGIPQNEIYILNVDDPFGGNIEVYRKSCNEIKEKLTELLGFIERKEEKS